MLILRRLVAALLLFLVGLALFPAPTMAQTGGADLAPEITKGFSSRSFDDVEKAINALAASGHPRAEVILKALADRALVVAADGRLLIEADGKTLNAVTGEASDAGGKTTAVRVNNKIRNVVSAALGTLTMMSPDPAKRLAAADSVFRTRDLESRAPLEAALVTEADPKVKARMAEARAVLLLADPAASEREKLDAVGILRERGDQEAKGILQTLPADTAAPIKTAAREAIEGIDASLAIWGVAQNFYYGLSLGSVLLLAAIGLAITFGVMGVINMAHGEMVMIGAYTTFVVQEVIRTSAPGLFDYSLLIALPLAFGVAGLIGMAIERGVIRFLYGRPLETLLATWGISLILQQAVRTLFGPTNREVGAPSFMSGAFELGGLVITYNRLWIIVFTLVVFAALLMILKMTSLGLQMRAVTQNRRMAAAMGIRTNRVDMLTFGLGSGIAGLAGVALSQIDNVSPNLGQGYIIDSFMVVVFGGVGNLWGTLVGAFTIGIANKFLEPYAGAVLGKIALLVFIILFIQKRPRGLFALKGRAVEA
jgi:urea transport system permease protein